MKTTKWFLLWLVPLLIWPQGKIKIRFPCSTCHSAEAWVPLAKPLPFDHGEVTNFPLTGTHARIACRSCHPAGNVEELHRFQRAPSSCTRCHPDPHDNRFGRFCQDCHLSSTWEMSVWYDRHEETLFPLLGGHRGVPCEDCHIAGNYRLDTDCRNCHADQFVPEVSGHQGYSQQDDCSLCHGPTRWQDILALNHDSFFPIHSGNHAFAWKSCSSCHSTPGDFTDFTCFGSGCHNATAMNSEHCEGGRCVSRNGYIYPAIGVTPEDCYHCHPRGTKGD